MASPAPSYALIVLGQFKARGLLLVTEKTMFPGLYFPLRNTIGCKVYPVGWQDPADWVTTLSLFSGVCRVWRVLTGVTGASTAMSALMTQAPAPSRRDESSFPR